MALAVDEHAKHRPERVSTQATASGDGYTITGYKTLVLDAANADAYEERAYRAMMGQFVRAHEASRKPVQAGFHFTLMNDGAYWRALERFAREVCGKADVTCRPIGAHVAMRNADSAIAELRY